MTAHVQIITEQTWICKKLSGHLSGEFGPIKFTVSDKPFGNPDATYFLTYLFREFYAPRGVGVGLFTHYIPGNHQARYDKIASQLDHCIVLNNTHQKYLANRVGGENVSRVHLPVKKTQNLPPLRVGWFHRSPSGYGRRKRADLLDYVRELPWVELVESNGKLNNDELRRAMRSVDVFLTVSDYESGPMSLLEALSFGKAVIIPEGVGLADEYADVPDVHLFEAGNVDSLLSALKQTYMPLKLKYSAINHNNVDQWRADHVEIFCKVLGIDVRENSYPITGRG